MTPEAHVITLEPEPWIDKAACRGISVRRGNHDLFFEQASRSLGRGICLTCPVAGECLGYSQRYEIDHGMWGGLDPEQRQRVLHIYGPVTHPRGRAGHILALNEMRERANRTANRKRGRDRR